MIKLAEKAYGSMVLAINYWIISRAVERASTRNLEREDGLFVDYML